MTSTDTPDAPEARGTVIVGGTARIATVWRDSTTVVYRTRGQGSPKSAVGAVAASFRLDPQQAAWVYELALAEDAARTADALDRAAMTRQLPDDDDERSAALGHPVLPAVGSEVELVDALTGGGRGRVIAHPGDDHVSCDVRPGEVLVTWNGGGSQIVAAGRLRVTWSPAPAGTYLCNTCLTESDAPGSHNHHGGDCGGTFMADHHAARVTAARRAAAEDRARTADAACAALDAVAADVAADRAEFDAEQDAADHENETRTAAARDAAELPAIDRQEARRPCRAFGTGCGGQLGSDGTCTTCGAVHEDVRGACCELLPGDQGPHSPTCPHAHASDVAAIETIAQHVPQPDGHGGKVLRRPVVPGRALAIVAELRQMQYRTDAVALLDELAALLTGADADEAAHIAMTGETTAETRARLAGEMVEAVADCTCLYSCADDPASACSLSGTWHVHPQDRRGVTGPCPVHPDAPGDH